jgi:MoaA/NifB/PqqE/SkfB family radical SAM enzyme
VLGRGRRAGVATALAFPQHGAMLGKSSTRRRRFAAWQIEITTRCALACRMCIRQAPDPWRHRDMTFGQFDALARGFGEVETVVLQGWGEPLLHPRLREIVRRAKAPVDGGPPAVGFVTSGQGLDARRAAELVEAGLDFIGFSLAGASAATHASIRVRSALEEVVAAAGHVIAARRERGTSRPRVHVVYLMVKDNVGELPGLPALARRMGAEEIVVTNLIHAVDAWQEEQQVFGREGAGEAERLLEETERRAREVGLPLRRASLSPAPAAVCEEDPLRNLYVTVDGEVSPCVYLCPPLAAGLRRRFAGQEHRLDPVSFGNAFREPIPAIRDGPAFRSFCERFARRAQRQRLLSLLPRSWRGGSGGSRVAELPEPPDPCRTCYKLLGV